MDDTDRELLKMIAARLEHNIDVTEKLRDAVEVLADDLLEQRQKLDERPCIRGNGDGSACQA